MNISNPHLICQNQLSPHIHRSKKPSTHRRESLYHRTSLLHRCSLDAYIRPQLYTLQCARRNTRYARRDKYTPRVHNIHIYTIDARCRRSRPRALYSHESRESRGARRRAGIYILYILSGAPRVLVAGQVVRAIRCSLIRVPSAAAYGSMWYMKGRGGEEEGREITRKRKSNGQEVKAIGIW